MPSGMWPRRHINGRRSLHWIGVPKDDLAVLVEDSQKTRQLSGGLLIAAEQKEPPPVTSEAALDGVGFAASHTADRTPLAI